MLTLGIESSCDDTAVAILKDDSTLLANLVSSQNDIHARFGGVVPELASRSHLTAIQPLVTSALQAAGKRLEDIDLIAATQGPGLIGSLLVGFSFAKALSYVSHIPLVGVDHMTGHLLSAFLEKERPSFPYIALIVSGGTTAIFRCDDLTSFTLLGRTRDDAAGEAFDKVAKLLNLGYPGGPLVSKRAEEGDKKSFSFPRAWLDKESLDFSFSGLKTAVSQNYRLHQTKEDPAQLAANICASFQEAVIDVLVQKTISAAQRHSIKTVVLGGGVSANKQLRLCMKKQCDTHKLSLYMPSPQFSTDNAAMIAIAGYYKFSQTHQKIGLDEDVFSRSQFV